MFMPAPFLDVKDCEAVKFDGFSSYMKRGAGLSGIADSKKGIFATWARIDGGDGTFQRLFCSANSIGSSFTRFIVERASSNKITIGGERAGGGNILQLETSGAYLASAAWIHVLASWDLGAGLGHLYVNGSSDLDVGPTLTDDTIDYTQADWAVGASGGGAFKFNGALAELYFAPGQYLDFSVEANRRKFISASGKPVNLRGAHGPTGSPAAVYLHVNDGAAAADFAKNNYGATGGPFTITGSLDIASTSPSD